MRVLKTEEMKQVSGGFLFLLSWLFKGHNAGYSQPKAYQAPHPVAPKQYSHGGKKG